MSEEQKLLLFERVPLGTTFAEAGRMIPELGTLRPEGLPDLSDASTDWVVMGYSTRAEFNFRRDTLYSVTFGVTLPADSGEVLFDRLNAFYSARFGEPIVEDEQDSPYFTRSRTWSVPGAEVGVLMSIADHRRILGWGYQPRINVPKDQ